MHIVYICMYIFIYIYVCVCVCVLYGRYMPFTVLLSALGTRLAGPLDCGHLVPGLWATQGDAHFWRKPTPRFAEEALGSAAGRHIGTGGFAYALVVSNCFNDFIHDIHGVGR